MILASLWLLVTLVQQEQFCKMTSITLSADKWLVRFNPSKSESLIISRKHNKPAHTVLLMYNTVIPQVNMNKHFGVFISSDGSWDNHLEYIIDKSLKKMNTMRSQSCA